MRRLLLICMFGLPASAVAQDGGGTDTAADVVRAADDAFGRRIGIEDVGLYSEGEVRGFNLQNAGNYRIEDHYYVRATGLPVAVSGGTLIRVGVNGLRTDFAAPSGVVQYDLPTAADGNGGTIEAGWWPGAGPALVGRFGINGGEDLSLFVGAQFNPWQAYTDGTGGTYGAVGLVPRWRPAPGVRLSAVGMASWFKRGSDTLFVTGGTPPPRVRRNYARSQDWMQSRTDARIAGLFGEAVLGDWDFAGSAFLSENEDLYGTLGLIILPGGGAPAEARVVFSPRETYTSASGELKAARSFRTGSLVNRLYAAARWRRSLSRTSPGVAAALGAVPDLDDVPQFDRPTDLPAAPRGRDEVRQWTLGLGYRGSLGELAEVRLDAQKVRYAKTVSPPGAETRREVSRPWLFSGSIAVAPARDLTLFASYARGLEEAGVAPGNATNRGEVLPAARAKQAEVGAKYAIPGGPSLIASLFDIAKPLPGLRADGSYAYIGEVRHRGLELSLAGALTPRLSAVIGATFLDASISGELVEAGLIGARPVGRPDTVALARLTWEVPGLEGLALDGGVNVRGERAANAANSLVLPSYRTVDLGLRQRFRLSGREFTLRARVGNLLNSYAWTVNGSGLFSPSNPRSYTLTLTGGV